MNSVMKISRIYLYKCHLNLMNKAPVLWPQVNFLNGPQTSQKSFLQDGIWNIVLYNTVQTYISEQNYVFIHNTQSPTRFFNIIIIGLCSSFQVYNSVTKGSYHSLSKSDFRRLIMRHTFGCYHNPLKIMFNTF